MKRKKKDRQALLKETISVNPFITDEELADKFSVSVQTIRLDRLELSIPELRERIKHVAEQNHSDEIRALTIDEVIGDVIDIELDKSGISILDIKKEHVFTRNNIARGHHLFAQANSLAVAIINDEFTLTAKANIIFTTPVKLHERVVAKAKVMNLDTDNNRSLVEVNSTVGNELVFKGTFEMYRSNTDKKDDSYNENRN
ncbi:transcription factor FapR [Bacillus testis]|uniref:transcription factor FapR n=1 Tax=Bacillus testis TaxID=1622072 RepID=UPI00067EEBDE|nr:transcription factor FapR [Bacillus testis]